jgi:hypothetical protein
MLTRLAVELWLVSTISHALTSGDRASRRLMPKCRPKTIVQWIPFHACSLIACIYRFRYIASDCIGSAQGNLFSKDSTMTTFENHSPPAKHARSRMIMLKAPSVPTWLGFLAAGAFSLALVAGPGHAQTVPATAAVSPPTINTNTTSCKELKSRLQNSGSLALVSGPRGWGDTYYARVPQCDFWQRPVFSYVTTNDGWCGVGYVCAAKISGR